VTHETALGALDRSKSSQSRGGQGLGVSPGSSSAARGMAGERLLQRSGAGTRSPAGCWRDGGCPGVSGRRVRGTGPSTAPPRPASSPACGGWSSSPGHRAL